MSRHLLLIGNTGVGKSYIGNALAGFEAFRSSHQVGSVTSAAQACHMTDGQGERWTVVDMPGLQEADSANLARNEREIRNAFSRADGAPTIVAFVITLEGGRLRSDHTETVTAVLSGVRGLTPENTMLIVNKVRDDEPEQEVRSCVLGYFSAHIKRVVLVPFVSPAERGNLQGQAVRRAVPQRILPVLQQCAASSVQATEIRLRAQKLEEERQRQVAEQRQEQERLARERAAEQHRQGQEKQRQREREQEAAREREARARREREEKERQIREEQRRRERDAEKAAELRRQRDEMERQQREAERREAELERQRNMAAAIERQRQMDMQLIAELQFQQMFGGGGRRRRVVMLNPWGGFW